MNQLLNKLRLSLLTILLIFISYSYAQVERPILLKSGKIIFDQNNSLSKELFTKAKLSSKNNSFVIIQFNEIPTSEAKEKLKNDGIFLLNYLPKNAYFAEITQNAKWQTLVDSKMFAVADIKNEYKLSKGLANQKYNDWALVGKNKISLNGVFFPSIKKSVIENLLTELGAKIESINNTQHVSFTISISKLENLYALAPFFYFEQIDPPSVPENLVGVTNHTSNTLATSYDNGLNYTGNGITVMLQDNSRLDNHIDYTGRFINSSSATNSGDHGEHCGGTIAGAGNLDPTTRGMAYGAEVLVYGSGNNNYDDVPALYANDNLRITSKSYSNGVNAGYTTLASSLDEQSRMMPELIHVFSAGNSNGLGNTAAGSQWYNITGGHKIAKNVIAVGNLDFTDGIASSSSRGPSEDGRIKPDICAVGTNVYSTVDPNTYDTKTGTSMSCPGVAGVIAQLYEGYRDLNGGNYPEAALIKAAVLNSGKDLGNPGPDFIYGWGRINARKAFDIISNNQYFSDEISQGGNISHNITVPSGIAQMRVMVYWSDYEALPNVSQALVNDINMTVVSPSVTIHNPWVLNNAPDANLLNMDATNSVDNVNNVEQVSIDIPQPGTYTINLDGFAIPTGPQKYYVVYEMLTDDIVLTYPIGGEGLDSDENEVIRWDAFNDLGTFTLEYSADDGSSWNPIATNINANRRFLLWNIPPIVTGEALVRVSRGGNSSQSHENFSIIQVPTNLQVTNICLDSVTVTWDSVAGATGYEVSILGNKYMDSVGTSTTNIATVPHSVLDDFWWSVKALGPDNCEGRRAIAVFQGNGPLNCNLDIDALIYDTTDLNGQSRFGCSEIEPFEIGITIFNNSSQTITSVPINYNLNGAIVNEVYSGSLAPNTNVYYSFTNQLPLQQGLNDLTIWSSLSGDQYLANNELDFQITYIEESMPETLPFFENFETFSLCETESNCGLEICALENNFVNIANGFGDDIDWRTNRGPTPTIPTGPSTDFNIGTPSGRYLYLEPSGTPQCINKEAQLVTPCINLDSDGFLSFAYSMFGADMGELHVDILINGVWTNDIMQVISGNRGQSWRQRSINLSPYTGNIVNFRFRGITGNGFRSDLAIDDIAVTSALNISPAQSTELTIYPNPTSGQVFYELNDVNNATIRIMDTNGKLVYSLNNLDSKGEIDLSNFAKGIYFVQLLKDRSTSVQKIIIE